MTGGRRVVDKGPSDGDEIYPAGTTIIEKAWHSGQGLFPDRDLTTSAIAGAPMYGTAPVQSVSVIHSLSASS